jgi:glycerol-3-phosphate dehydrogenase
MRMAPAAAKLLARELGKDQVWVDTQVESFLGLAAQYCLEKVAASA